MPTKFQLSSFLRLGDTEGGGFFDTPLPVSNVTKNTLVIY